MGQYIVPQGQFIKISEEKGTVQNVSRVVIEIAKSATPNSGICLYPQESRSYDEMPGYARAVGGNGPGVLQVVDFMETIPDGGTEEDEIATDSEVDEMLDEVLND